MSIQVGTSHADSLTGSGSLDLLFGRGGADTLTGGSGISGLFGGKGGDLLHDGTSGYSFMFGGRGDDVVVSTHADFMDGGCGTDTAVLLRSASTLSFNIDLSKCIQVLADGTIMTGFERLVFDGGSGDDVVKGGCLDDYLAGGAGHDKLYGGGGNDLILGNATDSLYGGNGDDTISITALPAVVDGGCGTDTLRIVGPMAFTPGIVTNVENFVVVDGFLNFNHVTGAGDIVSFNNFFDASGTPVTTGPGLVITVAETTLPGEPAQTQAAGVNILGSSHDDSITGGTGDDFLNGGRGNDTIHGGDGSDRIDGGTGLDWIYGDNGDDFIFSVNPDGQDIHLDGGDGNDFARIERTKETTPYSIDVSDSHHVATDSKGMTVVNIEYFDIQGGSASDTITSGAGDDKLAGNAGNDVLTSGAGSDWLIGGAGNDTLFGGDGTDYALFAGKLGDYGVVHNGDGSYTVTDLRIGSPEGTDTLWNVEYIVYDHTSDSVFGHAYLLT